MFTYDISFNLYNFFFVVGREDITILFLPINELIAKVNPLVRDGAKNQK